MSLTPQNFAEPDIGDLLNNTSIIKFHHNVEMGMKLSEVDNGKYVYRIIPAQTGTGDLRERSRTFFEIFANNY